MEKNQKNPERKKPYNQYLRYTSIGFQMAAIVGCMAWLGQYLDKRAENETAWYTLGLTLFGVFAALYLTLRDFIGKK